MKLPSEDCLDIILLAMEYRKCLAAHNLIKNCNSCKEEFLLMPDERRTKEYCSHACKVRAYRSRRKDKEQAA